MLKHYVLELLPPRPAATREEAREMPATRGRKIALFRRVKDGVISEENSAWLYSVSCGTRVTGIHGKGEEELISFVREPLHHKNVPGGALIDVLTVRDELQRNPVSPRSGRLP